MKVHYKAESFKSQVRRCHMKRLAPFAIAVVFVLAFTLRSSTQDIGKASSGQTSAQTQKEVKALAPQTFSCATECGFSVTSRSTEEIIGIVIAHARTFHQKELTPEDVTAKINVGQEEEKKKMGK
jgi:predicted small metal-binding protein